MDEKSKKDHLKITIDWAIRKGVPPGMLEGINDPYAIILLFMQWEKLQKLEEYDRNRIRDGMEPLRPYLMHRLKTDK